MIKPCVRCKNQQGDNELRDIRGNVNVEGYLIAHYPEVLQISENDPIEVCDKCYRELNSKNDDYRSNKSKSQNRSRVISMIQQSLIRDSEDVPIESQSMGSTIDAPLSSSLGENQQVIINLELLKLPGEIEKLIPNNRNVQRNVRQLLAQAMPAAAKKRKLQEMLENVPNVRFDNAGQGSNSNSPSQTVIERPKPRSTEDPAERMFRMLASQSGRVNRSYKNDSSIHSSQSSSLNQSSSRSISDINIVPSIIRSFSPEIVVEPSEVITQPPLSPIISDRIRQPSPHRSRALLYQPDSSSDSDRVRNASMQSNNESRRSSERVASKSPSAPIDNVPVAKPKAVRPRKRQNDGNDHSNLAAPRRVNMTPPSTTRPQNTIKTTMGG
ncbi:uncharacterized protein [Chironomus tepperi]|uniref:uncharacterized protein n=1 Tax=Chironomus tepperi TaxID=113505 RepID=UPI00391FAAB1